MSKRKNNKKEHQNSSFSQKIQKKASAEKQTPTRTLNDYFSKRNGKPLNFDVKPKIDFEIEINLNVLGTMMKKTYFFVLQPIDNQEISKANTSTATTITTTTTSTNSTECIATSTQPQCCSSEILVSMTARMNMNVDITNTGITYYYYFIFFPIFYCLFFPLIFCSRCYFS